MTDEAPPPAGQDWRARLGPRSIVLVGMMGSGKSTIGARLAQRIGLRFVDADAEIETAAGMSIPDIFATRGEAEFRAGERRVIARLLTQGPRIVATGGGAFMNEETRARIAEHGLSIWLKADVDTLMRRVRKRANRPLLQTEDPEATLRALLAAREPTYALADITITSQDDPHDVVVDAVIAALDARLPVTAAA
jgi:shikimate kinase